MADGNKRCGSFLFLWYLRRNAALLARPVEQLINDNTLVAFIQRWGEEQELEPQVAAKLLYYLTKPKGSTTRARFQQIAQQDADQLGIQLPQDYQ